MPCSEKKAKIGMEGGKNLENLVICVIILPVVI